VRGPPRLEAEAKRQTTKEPVKNVGSNFMDVRSGLFLVFKTLPFIIIFVSIIVVELFVNNLMLSNYGK